MCDKAVIYAKKKDIQKDDINYLHELLKTKQFSFSSNSVIEYQEYLNKIEMNPGCLLRKERRKLKKKRKLEKKNGIKIIPKEILNLSLDEKNTVVVCIDGYKGSCLCSLEDDNLIYDILKKCIEYFDEVFYDPNCFVYVGDLKIQSDNVVSLNETINKRILRPSMTFKPIMKIVK